MITKDLIHEAQNKWGEGIVKIGSLTPTPAGLHQRSRTKNCQKSGKNSHTSPGPKPTRQAHTDLLFLTPSL